jgi:hypothetical protein
MAVPVFPGNQQFSIICFDQLAVPTAMYIYANGISRGEMAEQVGRKDKAGAIVNGSLAAFLAALPATADAADLGSATVEEDTDANSPHLGRLRINITIAATAA